MEKREDKTQFNLPERALIVRPFFANLIVRGEKSIEVRSSCTLIRGRIAIISAGSGEIVGECRLIDCKKFTKEDYQKNRTNHYIKESYEDLPAGYKRNGHFWLFDVNTAVKYEKPLKYTHPRGAVIWVKLTQDNVSES